MNNEKIEHQTQTILESFYEMVSEKDAESIANLFSDQFDWYIPKSDLLPWTGKQTEKSGIIKILRLLFEAHIDDQDQLEHDHIFIDGNQAAVFGKISRQVKKTEKRFTTDFCQKFTIQDGKITKFLMLEDTPQIENAFN
jgi:ketosteroid isomerase-like protein